MAGTMVHLTIADKLADKWSGGIYTPYGRVKLSYSFFIAGNICPDGIMARKNYERDMKKHTHFRDGIPDCDFYREENLALFRSRLDAFMKESFKELENDCEKSLYLGYWTHMIADERFMLDVRPKFMENIAAIGLTQHDMETFKYFGRDTDLIDFRLVKEYGGMRRVYAALKDIEPYEIKKMIEKDELTDSRKWILEYFFETKREDIEEPKYISYGDLLEFIDDAVRECDKRRLAGIKNMTSSDKEKIPSQRP